MYMVSLIIIGIKNMNSEKIMIIWTEYALDFVRKNYSTQGSNFCSEHLGIPAQKIRDKARQMKIKQLPETRCSRWKNNCVDFLRDNYSNKGGQYCSEMLNIPIKQVHKKASELGLRVEKEIISKSQSMRSPRYRPSQCGVNADLLCNPSDPVSAYILGLLWADGNLQHSKNNRYKIVIEVKSSDFNYFHPLLLHVGKWTVSHRKRPGRSRQSTACISNHALYDFLLSMDYGPGSEKSACKILDIIPVNLHNYWFHGLFDGDGCFYVHTKGVYQTDISGSYNQDWFFVEQKYKSLGITFAIDRREQYCKKSGNVSRSSSVRTSSKMDLIKIGDFIYNNGCLGLNRKYKKYEYVKNRFAL